MKIALITAVLCFFAIVASSSQTVNTNYIFNFSATNAELSDSAKEQLELIAAAMKEDTNITVRIVGHTSLTEMDNVAANQKLSEDRAKICIMYLRASGVQQRRIFASGVGSRQPVAADDTEEDRAKNRRVEVRIIRM